MNFSYLVIDDATTPTTRTVSLFNHFPEYFYLGKLKHSDNLEEAISRLKPKIIVVTIPLDDKEADRVFKMVSELFQYLDHLPYFIALSNSKNHAFDAIQSGFSDYLIDNYSLHQLGKSLFKFEKRVSAEEPKILCLKSYSDYQFVTLEEIIYLKADNNSVDIKLINGKIITAFKTLKSFEKSLPFYFLRVHKSYIINIHYVSRIHFSKSKCYLNYNEIIPFSLTYKDNIDLAFRKVQV